MIRWRLVVSDPSQDGLYGRTLLEDIDGDRLTPPGGILITDLSPVRNCLVRLCPDNNERLSLADYMGTQSVGGRTAETDDWEE